MFPVVDVLFAPFTLLSSMLLFLIRRMRIAKMPVSKAIFKKVGLFPITDHYYEPLFDDRHLKLALDRDRPLPGIDWNTEAQLALLDTFSYQKELAAIPFGKTADPLAFYYDNPSLRQGDAEYLYCMVRHFKPARIIEVGSGYSTLMMQRAIRDQQQADPAYRPEPVCVEPYEMPWLEQTGIRIIRKRVEELDTAFFKSLQKDDILFIDSSHMVRPQGDVLFEFLEILPILAPGVIIHVHDIFSPRDYTRQHLVKDVMFWNEQYILEAFLTCNPHFRIIGALNFLKNNYPERMNAKLPMLAEDQSSVPGSFWMQRV